VPWRTTTPMAERARFVLEAEHTFLPFAELCRRYGISRPTGYKWLRRYRSDGLAGLEEGSHRPHSCPHATPGPVEERILELRQQRGWGARKLRVVLEREIGWAPSVDTIHRILTRSGEVEPRRKVGRQRGNITSHLSVPDRPNAVWTADLRGAVQDARWGLLLSA
jgi:transposase-like protein